MTSILATAKNEKWDLIDLRKHIITFMTAGHETTATALGWALYVLAIHQNYQTELRETLTFDKPSWDEIQNNKFLEMVCNEVLRLYAPASAIVRKCTKSFTFKDMSFPSGTYFNIPLQDLQLNEAFKEPWVFNPKREKVNDLYMPFWTGNRGCIGKQLAIVEFKTILAILIKEFKFTIDEDERDVKRVSRITQRPDKMNLNIQKIKQ